MGQHKKKKKIFVVIGLCAILILVGLSVREVYFVRPKIENFSNAQNIFVVKKGESFRDIGLNLQKAGLIKSKFWFDIFVLFSGRLSKLQAGACDFSDGPTISQIVNKISQGDVKKEKITILEGWNVFDIANYLEQKQIFSQDDFLTAAKEKTKEIQEIFSSEPFLMFDFLSSNGRLVGLEGFLFPDTYEFVFGSSISDMLREMLANFKTKISDDLRSEIKKQNKTIYEILIMASLLEKEVKTYSDKQLVAGILWKRLENNWPLQVDATLNYILDKPSAKLFLDDLQVNSPYNTYLYKGLPPGPICNPGLESIKAAVYYKQNPYWYYLSSPSGQTIFSETFEEHKAAKAKYLR
ncbi:endolytic transglycosylase MltG [bacterium (Candidatus Gribaldobacteria) CG08_land_8_20_14_0_20_39_15]|uniref:Endolytic murein transglycosylase n=1 Tax=bacterium (Candidatus Gribaldobacteria) CG08_land_8_20_14_0_20_39_15 TaxID=2014273 RepID=A0A2M6XUV3_9BACT|nr:MAG: endolytic transglycosylase MltG [bacterium (Candidatus Gribaldobacteria) CG08_land_8_20_14_0_20_39_15]